MVLEAAVNGGADALVTFNVRDYENAAAQFAVEVLLPRDAIMRIKR
jgi:Zn-dependent peptidase ImmA (M78 family)